MVIKQPLTFTLITLTEVLYISQISGTNKSTTSSGGSQVAYNDAAYNQRIALMKQTALSYCQAGGNLVLN